MRHFLVLSLFCLTLITVLAQAQPQRVMLVVTAHPDDEEFMGPVLARYARDGVKVFLAIATKGEKGVREHAGIPAGDPLANVRHQEAACACKQLGTEPPIFFDLNDGELAAITSPPAKNVQAVADSVQQLIEKIKPQVVVTWGPEGGYGHTDHRMVSNAVTQTVQAAKSNIKLYYMALTTIQASIMDSSGPWHGILVWRGTDPSHLSTNVIFTKDDQAAFHRAIECHKTQFTPEEMHKLEQALDTGWADSRVAFRSWMGQKKSDNLFK